MNNPYKDNVIHLDSLRFPVGSKAWHPDYHVCTVIECSGNQRKVKALKLGTLETIWEYMLVDVNELQRLPSPPM